MHLETVHEIRTRTSMLRSGGAHPNGADMIGTRIGSIRLEALLGEGGMGYVYRGFDEKLERRVAVKTIRPQRRLKPETQARFLREARLLSRLEHPNICRVYDLVEGEDSDYLVLEYLEGRTLRQVLERGDDELDPLRIAEEVASALAAAHQRKVVHRDLKPENIMLSPSGEAKVLDFGIARSVDPLPQNGAARDLGARSLDDVATETVVPGRAGRNGDPTDGSRSGSTFYTEQGAILGTVRYMSPEQASGGELTEASDMYALGILLQEMVTGHPAYGGAQGLDLLVKVGRGEALPVEVCDEELRSLIEDLKSLQPADRPGAEETIRRLGRIRAKPALQRRRRLLVGSAALVVLLLSATGLITYVLARPEPLLAAGTSGRIALLPFDNATADPGLDWVELGLLQMVAETVDVAPEIEVVPVEEVILGVRRLQEGGGASLSGDGANRLLRALGAELVVRTTVVRSDAGYGFRYEVLRPQGRSLEKLVTAAELTAGAAELARRLVLRLRPEAHTVALSDVFSEDPYVNRTYAMGVQQASATGPETARHYFEVCLDRDMGMQWARLALAQALHRLGSNDDGDALVEEVLAAAEVRSDPRLAAAALRQRGTVHLDRGDYAAATESFTRSLGMDAETSDRNGRVDSLSRLAATAYRSGNLDLAEEHWRHAMVDARELGSRSWEARLMNNLGIVAYERGDFETAEGLWSGALEAMRDLGHLVGEALIIGNLGLIAEAGGDLDRACAMHREELGIQRRLGDRQAESIALYNLAHTTRRAGEWEAAEELVLESASLASELDNPLIEALSLAELAGLEARRGALNEAEARLDRLRSLALDDPDAHAARLAAMAYLGIRRGDLASADQRLSSLEGPEGDPDLMMLRARWYFAAGRFGEALAVASDARDLAGEGWTRVQEEDRRAYEVATQLGRAVPLPSEP